MPKRKFEATDGLSHLPKRRRVGSAVQLEDISDELVLRILSFLTPHEVGVAASTSHRFHLLANDNESWKERYYSRWVRPRVLQIPSTTPRAIRDIPRYSAKSANWLDHRHLLFPSKITDWKWQYRIRNNWHHGTCNVQNLEVSQPPSAPVIVKAHDGIVFEAAFTGLTAWSSARGSTPLASHSFCTRSSEEHPPTPTAMALDTSCDVLRIGIGFLDSTFQCYEYSKDSGLVECCAPQYFLDPKAPVSLLLISFPFVFALLDSDKFLLKRLKPKGSSRSALWEELAFLKSNQRHLCSPSLALRRIGKEIVASIAYTSEILSNRWCLGVQELRISYSPLATLGTLPSPHLGMGGGSDTFVDVPQWHKRTFQAWTPPFPMHPAIDSRPRALSYSHPYLLSALPDNTMMVYLVHSSAKGLSLSDGSRLWGHTSGISNAEVNTRGKAVTTSTKGGEVRVWDLEGVARGHAQGNTSTPVVPTKSSTSMWPPGSAQYSADDRHLRLEDDQLAFKKSWIAFDEQQVLVLGERTDKRVLARYDFTR